MRRKTGTCARSACFAASEHSGRRSDVSARGAGHVAVRRGHDERRSPRVRDDRRYIRGPGACRRVRGYAHEEGRSQGGHGHDVLAGVDGIREQHRRRRARRIRREESRAERQSSRRAAHARGPSHGWLVRDVIVIVIAALAGCAASARPLPATHPAHATAPVGRLAGAPASLRPGVVEYKDVPATREAPPPIDHSHHHH
jgi:hypothetical protein